MKKVITMVGTSIFENYYEIDGESSTKNYFDTLKEKKCLEWENERERIQRLKNTIQNWTSKQLDKENLSAEIKSLIKLNQELRDEIEIYLLHSDTILSKLAGEIIREIMHSIENLKNLEIKIEDIKGLQILDRKEFNEGMANLVNKIYGIANGYWDNVVINITGGYKATIPYLTILAQINKCPIYYIFEETEALIKIPYIPIDVNWKIFEENEEFFRGLEKDEIKEIDEKIEKNDEIMALLEFADNLYSLNSLGIILWERYKAGFEIFRISNEVQNYIEKYPDKKAIIKKSFLELKRRLKSNPRDQDLNHYLIDINLPKGFKTFKHKEDNLQVRILYRSEPYETRYGVKEIEVYIVIIAVGSEVHNAESEYVELFRRKGESIINKDKYKVYKIRKGV